MTQTNRSTKIDLPRPNPHVLYCIYLTVLVERGGEPYDTILFYTYAPVNSGYSYSRFIEDRKRLCPLHSARIKDYLMTFEKERACPCGYSEKQ